MMIGHNKSCQTNALAMIVALRFLRQTIVPEQTILDIAKKARYNEIMYGYKNDVGQSIQSSLIHTKTQENNLGSCHSRMTPTNRQCSWEMHVFVMDVSCHWLRATLQKTSVHYCHDLLTIYINSLHS